MTCERWFLISDERYTYLLDDNSGVQYEYSTYRQLKGLLDTLTCNGTMSMDDARFLARSLPVHFRGQFTSVG